MQADVMQRQAIDSNRLRLTVTQRWQIQRAVLPWLERALDRAIVSRHHVLYEMLRCRGQRLKRGDTYNRPYYPA